MSDSTPHLALDEEKLEMLHRWGEGLRRDEREEVAAAGRAILMLVEEVERLHVELWNATRLFPQEQSSVEELAQDNEPASPAQALSERLKQGARHLEQRRSD